MTMENAKVGVFEDNRSMQILISVLLNRAGHAVMIEADSFAKAMAAIDESEPGIIDVALVDGDLGLSHDEGGLVVRMLRRKMGDIAIIGISTLPEGIEDADINISKFHIEKIVNHINEL